LSDTLLEVRGLSRRFGALMAVDDLSFAVRRGEVYGFIGPNGAGKTTTMRIIATIDLPDEGDAFVEGLSVLIEPRKVRRRIGFMPDQFIPYPNLDVSQYLDFFARAYGLRGKERLRTVESVVGFCRLEGFRTRPTTGLSKGMSQRLHLAKTLLHDPALLILDEPAAGLDPHARIELRELIGALAEAGKGILISSHILSELGEVCDGIVVIEQGRRVAAGDIDTIAREHQAHETLRVRTLGNPAELETFLLTQPGVSGLRPMPSGFLLEFAGDDEALADLLARAMKQEVRIVEFARVVTNLEEIFMRTTRGRLQ
jgi:ABC-2 type transport system ATP-binding protein